MGACEAALSPRGVGAFVPAAVARHHGFEAARRFRLAGPDPYYLHPPEGISGTEVDLV